MLHQISKPAIGVDLSGAFRVRLYNSAEYARLRAKHEDWPHEYILARMGLDLDTGWKKNVITDLGRYRLAGVQAWTTFAYIFIHEGTQPGDVDLNFLQFTYANQTPSQLKLDGAPVFDPDALLQTRTVTFSNPAVTRNINMVGLSNDTAVDTNGRHILGVHAFTVLPSTVVQTTVQTADVQHKVTWSFE
jgi:hypothetical protein